MQVGILIILYVLFVLCNNIITILDKSKNNESIVEGRTLVPKTYLKDSDVAGVSSQMQIKK